MSIECDGEMPYYDHLGGVNMSIGTQSSKQPQNPLESMMIPGKACEIPGKHRKIPGK